MRWISICFVQLLTVAGANGAEPFLPSDDSQVLEQLPRELLSSRSEIAKLRQQLANDPQNVELASDLARQYVRLGNSGGDPRFYGYARAALATWWNLESAPAPVLKLRAKLQEKEHDYDAALADLNLLLGKQPQDVQAWIELSNIYRVKGDYAQAQQACERLSDFAGPIPNMMCQAPLLAVTGQAEKAAEMLASIPASMMEKLPDVTPWKLASEAEFSRILGRDEVAEQFFINGLASHPNDFYLLRAYGDFLLDRQKNEQAFQLLRDHVSDNGVLLLAAIAAHRTGAKELAEQWKSQLENRFEELRLRGSQPHGRFESRFALELQDDPQRALAVAADNWAKQKESRDTRNLLEAALAANNPQVAEPAIAFLKQHSSQDVELKRLAEQLAELQESP